MLTTCFLVAIFIYTANAEIVDCNAGNRRSGIKNRLSGRNINRNRPGHQEWTSDKCECDPLFSGELCYLDCAEEGKCQNTILECRSGDICVIDCSAEDSCDGNTIILGSEATHLSVICGDDDSCRGNVQIYCGTGHCQIFCGDDDSCQNTTIYTDTASSFVCVPSINCQYAASDTETKFGEIFPIATTNEPEMTDFFVSDTLFPQSQPNAKMSAGNIDRASNVNIGDFVIAIIGTLSLVVIAVLFVGLGCFIRKKRMENEVLCFKSKKSTEMIHYGTL